MELPKNITQIGEADRTCKVYVEDYVVSYMKQLCRRTGEKGLAIALYGKYTKEQSLSYYFIYGACQVLSISREVRHLSQAQNQEVERLRQHYFPEYDFLGYHIFNGEMVEGMHIREQDTCRYIKGYACFYEKNDSMLAYMVENKVQDHEPEQFGQEKYDRARVKQEERRSQYEQKNQQPSNAVPMSDKLKKRTEKGAQDPAQAASLKMMRMSAVAVFAVLCLVGVAAITREDGEGTLGERAQQLWAQLWDELPKPDDPAQEGEAQEGEAQEATAEVHDSGTLMAENSLADAILQENQQTSEVSGPAVAGRPQEGEGGQGGVQPGSSQEGGDGQSQPGANGQGETIGQPGASGQGETAGQPGTNGQAGATDQSGTTGQGGTTGQPGASGQGETAGQTGTNSQTGAVGQTGTPGQTGTTGQGEASEGEEMPSQGQESLNPDLQAPEVQPGGEPQEIPAQGPSIADIEAQQKPYSASYVIQPGDTLIGISTRQYGNDSYVQAICDLNGIVNPDNIQIGQKILLP